MNNSRLHLQYNAPVILTFAVLSLAVLLLGVFTGGASTGLLFCVYRCSLRDVLAYPRFLLHVLGHSGYAHYINNMLLLLIVGPAMEEKYGSRRLLLFFIITALATGLVQFIFFPGSALMGASGIVFMLIMLSSLAGAEDGAIPITLILVAVLYLGGEILDGIRQADQISQLTHIVGGVLGIVFGFACRTGKTAKRSKERKKK